MVKTQEEITTCGVRHVLSIKKLLLWLHVSGIKEGPIFVKLEGCFHRRYCCKAIKANTNKKGMLITRFGLIMSPKKSIYRTSVGVISVKQFFMNVNCLKSDYSTQT